MSYQKYFENKQSYLSFNHLYKSVQHGGDLTQTGGNLTQTGGNLTQTGGNSTQTGGNLTQTGGDIVDVKTNERTFTTHDNGSYPYKYTINYKTGEINVYEVIEGESPEDDVYKDTPVLHLNKSNYEKFFVGHNHGRESWYCGGDDYVSGEGNSLLIHISGNDYIFVGSMIKHMNIPDVVLYVASSIGNNDVPYPVIVGMRLVIETGIDNILRKSELKIGHMINQMMLTAYGREYGAKKHNLKDRLLEKKVYNMIVKDLKNNEVSSFVKKIKKTQ